MAGFYLISGCSGGGKSTLLQALSKAGFTTVPEPGRRIVEDALGGDESVLPWVDLNAFARRAMAVSEADLTAAKARKAPVFFDRGIIDAAVALEHASGVGLEALLGDRRPYARLVFIAPPWPDIFETDSERRHTFADAVGEYERLTGAFQRLGYDQRELPKGSVEERVRFVVDAIPKPLSAPDSV